MMLIQGYPTHDRQSAAAAQTVNQPLQRAIQLHQSGKLSEARELYQRFLGEDPDNAAANYLLGTLHLQQGRNDEAVLLLQRAVAREPANAAAHGNLGVALKGLGRLTEAIAAYQTALDYKPGDAFALNNMGVAQMGLGEVSAAADCFRGALKTMPDYLEAHNNLGRALEALGDMEGAAESYSGAIKIKPDCGEAHLALACLAPASTKHVAAMQALVDEPGLDDTQREYFAFALGKALEDQGEYDSAFEHFREGNRLHRTANPFTLKTQGEYFSRLQEIFDAECFSGNEAGNDSGGAESPPPIFVIGMPRSGTSLIEQILASHAEVFGAGEVLYLHEICGMEAENAGTALPEGFAGFDGAAFRNIADRYLGKLRHHAPDARRIVDKMPQNFLYAGAICRMFPGAKIIHCRRNPMDTCLSIYKRFFISPHPFGYDLAELGGYYRLYEGLMAHWNGVLPGKILDVAYEDLVSDPQPEIERMLDYCELSFDPACLEFYKTERVVATASAAQVRKPLYQGSVDAWKRYEKHLVPLREALE